MEHNPEIDWHTGDIHMTRCPATYRSATEMDSLSDLAQLKSESAESMKGLARAKPHH